MVNSLVCDYKNGLAHITYGGGDMSFDTLAIKKMYRTKQDNIVDLFLAPALKESVLYDCGSGYFTLNSLSELAEGLIPFIRHGGQMRVVTSVELNENDVKVLEAGLKIQSETIISKLHEKVAAQLDDPDALLNLDVITNLIASGKIVIKVAYMPEGIYHEKIGLMRDSEGNYIYYSGSANATLSGLKKNWENIMVLTSMWNDQEIITDQIRYFDDLWEDKIDELVVLPFPEAEKRELIRKYKASPDVDTAIARLIGKSSSTKKKKKELYEYQKTAVDQFISNEGCHFFEMATGTGKTFTAVKAILKLAEKEKRLSVVIIVPQIDLQNQWAAALAEEDIKGLMLGGNADANETEYNFSTFLINSYEDSGLDVVVSTYDTFFSKYIKQCLQLSNRMLFVVDEAHNLSPNQIRQLPDAIRFRLGLSATPERYDKDETSRIITYFTKSNIDTYKYTIEEAISAGYLSHYIYYPIFVHVTDSEFSSYKNYTKQVIVALNEEPRDQKKITDILTRRSSIIKKSSSKLSALRDMVSLPSHLQYTFKNSVVYCGHGKDFETDGSIIDSVTKILAVDGHYSVSQFTSKTVDRPRVLKEFENENYDVLVAIKCFDEGVDVPKLDKIYIMASDGLSRQTIQRRGRVLRKCSETGKRIAYIYDFVALPPEGVHDGLGVSNLVGNELKRAIEYARLSDNLIDNEQTIESIMQMYGINQEDITDELGE